MRKYRVVIDGRETIIEVKEEYVEGINYFLDKIFEFNDKEGINLSPGLDVVELLDE